MLYKLKKKKKDTSSLEEENMNIFRGDGIKCAVGAQQQKISRVNGGQLENMVDNRKWTKGLLMPVWRAGQARGGGSGEAETHSHQGLPTRAVWLDVKQRS